MAGRVIPDKDCRSDTSDQFDPAWYLETYPDVTASGLDPFEHYQMYGQPMGRDPNPWFSNWFYQYAFASIVKTQAPGPALASHRKKTGSAPKPDEGRVLAAAQGLLKRGAVDLAVTLAERYMPEKYAHAVHIIRANQAQIYLDTGAWEKSVNAYLKHFGMAPIVLLPPHGQNTASASHQDSDVFERLRCAPGAPINDGPKVTVLMAVHNASGTLEKAVGSILQQTWQNLELIAIDDCSSDNSWQILKRLAQEDPRLKIHHSPVNAGPYTCRNIGLNMATGDWITGHDADDWAHPYRLEMHMKDVLATRSPPPASMTYMARLRANGFFDTIVDANPFSPDGVTRRSSISALYNAEFMRGKLGYWDTVKVGADSEMIARTGLVMGYDVPLIKQVGMLCLSTEQGLTRDPILGIRINGELSKVRAAYQRAWITAHNDKTRKDLFLEFPQKERRYSGEFGFEIPEADVKMAFESARKALHR